MRDLVSYYYFIHKPQLSSFLLFLSSNKIRLPIQYCMTCLLVFQISLSSFAEARGVELFMFSVFLSTIKKNLFKNELYCIPILTKFVSL